MTAPWMWSRCSRCFYTASQTRLPNTVRHFDRFPKVPQPVGNPLTPDFSIVFEDGGGLVGEIARMALNDESVDGICRQIANYDALPTLPGENGQIEISHCDVLLLVPQAVGPQAVKRIIGDRLADPDHPYMPSHPPCIVQFGFDDGRYTFQRLLDPENGMPRDGEGARAS